MKSILFRYFGFGRPPPGYCVETNGYGWRWVKPRSPAMYGGLCPLRSPPFVTRNKTIREAWRNLRESERAAAEWREEDL